MIPSRVEVDQIFKKNTSDKLASKSAKSGYYSALTQISMFILSSVSTLVLARLLTPDDFGLIAMVAVFINFASMFKDAGLSMATVQKDDITQNEISGLFWVNVIISFVLALVMVAISPLVVSFYERNEVGLILIILSVSFFISGLSVQHKAILQRLLRFDLIGIVQVASQAIGLIVAVIMALMGFEYMALVLNTLIINIVMTLLIIYFVKWTPSRTFNFKKIKDMLLFGGNITGFNLVNYFSRNGDNIIIGKILGSDELGVYSKAYQIFMMPVRQIRIPINAVTIPVLSRLQNEPERFSKYCGLFAEILALVSMPLTLICYLEADFIIEVMLGDGWEKATPVFSVLALAGFLQIVLGMRGSVMVSLGLTRRYFWMGVIYAMASLISFIVGVQYGIYGVAAAFVIVQYILFVPSLYYSFYKTPFTVSAFFKAVLPQILVGGTLFVIHLILKSNFDWNTFLSLASIAVICLTFLGVNYLRKDFRNQMLSIIKQIRM